MRGVRVLELSGDIAGAYCTRVLAALGADVVTLEPPQGSPLRHRGPWIPDIADPLLDRGAAARCTCTSTMASARWWPTAPIATG